MADEGFFSRWSRRKAESADDKQLPPATIPKQPSDTPAPPDSRSEGPLQAGLPDQPQPELTMEDVGKLTSDSDYSAFVARGVDENVKRSALKKLFSNPHFNVMDGLDVYIEDYNKFEPIPPEMLAALNHAKALLDPLSQLEKPVMPLADNSGESAEASSEDDVQQEDRPELTTVATADEPDVPAADEEGVPDAGQEDFPASATTADPTKPSEARS